MSAPERRQIVLGSDLHRKFVGSLVASLDRGWMVTLDAPRRSIPQNSTLHMLIADAVAGGLAADNGRRLTLSEAKVAFVSAWMMDEGMESDIIAFGGHAVQLRRSTTELSKEECARLIDFVMASCAQRGIEVRDPGELRGAA
ncbi:MAG: recombination protein NinB [Proteobacteria bacterium]|nr:recombination protein NinB [Pseudomonadota bacterium]